MTITFKIRVTSPGPEEAELLRTALKAAFGDALSLAKARKGGNPKYADRPDVLAYGELELSRDELEAAAALKPATRSKPTPPASAGALKPATRSKPTRSKPTPPAPAYTQATISLKPARRRRKKV